jgi:putative phosphoesterase
VLSIFREAKVDYILHAGDVCIPGVLEQLRELAPVYAVRGNRDWFELRSLPMTLALEFEGVKIGLMHGHGSLGVYLGDKVKTLFLGTQPERYLRRAYSAFPGTKVVIFGHTHFPVKRWVDGRFYFNPGSAAFPINKAPAPSVGILRIGPDKQINADILYY